jgi:hypothetical protein
MKILPITWSQLAKLNSVRFINSMYVWIFVVPIVAKLLENVGGPVQLTIFEHTFYIHLSLPFSWVSFYFSALFFALANLVFQIRCPNVVKEQQDYSQFRQANRGVEHLDSYLPEIGMNWEGLRQNLENQDKYFEEIAEVSNPKQDDGLLRKRFWVIYATGEKSRPISKFFAVVFYFVGGVLILVVLGQNILYVAKYLLGR